MVTWKKNMIFKQATTHDFLVGNRECNTERGCIQNWGFYNKKLHSAATCKPQDRSQT